MNLDYRDGLVVRKEQRTYENGKERIDLSLIGKVMANKLPIGMCLNVL